MEASQNTFELSVGRCFSNGHFGRNWQVRQIIGLDEASVAYKVLVGPNRRRRGTCTRSEFTRWIGYEVRRDENSWVRKR